MSYASLIDREKVSQRERLDDRQIKNNTDGYVYALDDWARLDRFLILGSEAPTYYQKARALTRENASCVERCWSEDHVRTAARIVEIDVSGRAPKSGPAILALALGAIHDDQAVRAAALDAVGLVCQTASELFEFAALLDALGRGWGRSVSRMFEKWYNDKSVDDLANQMTKYRERNGYDHRRVMKRAHIRLDGDDQGRVALIRFACRGGLDGYALPDKLVGHIAAMKTDDASELVRIIERHGLTWEQVPTWALKDARVWEAMLPNLPMKALLRNLSTLTQLGVIKPLGAHASSIADKLVDETLVRRSRLHPYAILNALAVYRTGRSVKGERTWKAVSTIIDALDEAFYVAFGNVAPTGKRHLLAVDVSASMTWQQNFIGGVLAPREAAAAMSMVAARVEKKHHFVAFSNDAKQLDVTARMSLGEVSREMGRLDAASTDCAAPMLYALKHGLEVDAFFVYTDNETNARSMHPSVALRKYRKETGIDAKLVVVGLSSTGFMIADPKDAGMLDVVGFDAKAVSVMGDFVRS